MAFKDLLQSQKTIRELKTETAALRLEKARSRPPKGTAGGPCRRRKSGSRPGSRRPPAGADRSGGSRPKSPL